jgi:hypothetical protein
LLCINIDLLGVSLSGYSVTVLRKLPRHAQREESCHLDAPFVEFGLGIEHVKQMVAFERWLPLATHCLVVTSRRFTPRSCKPLKSHD